MAGASGLSLALVVAAAGYGTRLDSGLPKQYVPLLGIPMLQRTLSALSSCPEVDALVVVVNPQDMEYCLNEIAMERIGKVVQVTGGGEERAFSVRNGLLGVGRGRLVGPGRRARRSAAPGDVRRDRAGRRGPGGRSHSGRGRAGRAQHRYGQDRRRRRHHSQHSRRGAASGGRRHRRSSAGRS